MVGKVVLFDFFERWHMCGDKDRVDDMSCLLYLQNLGGATRGVHIGRKMCLPGGVK
jgi:hypothetical protein